mmetsp:Transcript_5969/g.19477  ORF Transcript_5969/g.19477 Transcript_5969/m.19477 type:complete len:192 (+) Transcript_5969:53-628(+)
MKIICALDKSACTDRAVEVAVSLCRGQTDLYLLHVIPLVSSSLLDPLHDKVELINNFQLKEDASILADQITQKLQHIDGVEIVTAEQRSVKKRPRRSTSSASPSSSTLSSPSSAAIPNIRAHLRHYEGDPAKVLIAAVSELDADLIVVGHGGKALVSRLVLGSVSESVVRGAPCPVVVVKENMDKTPKALK